MRNLLPNQLQDWMLLFTFAIMSDCYHQLYYHLIFGTAGRMSLIHEADQEALNQYMTGILKSMDCKVIKIGGVADHRHILLSIPPKHAISTIVRNLKSRSSAWMNQCRTHGRYIFGWQIGYAVFSYSKSLVPNVARYIENQPEHHAHATYAQEFRLMLDRANIPYNAAYIPRDEE